MARRGRRRWTTPLISLNGTCWGTAEAIWWYARDGLSTHHGLETADDLGGSIDHLLEGCVDLFLGVPVMKSRSSA